MNHNSKHAKKKHTWLIFSSLTHGQYPVFIEAVVSSSQSENIFFLTKSLSNWFRHLSYFLIGSLHNLTQSWLTLTDDVDIGVR